MAVLSQEAYAQILVQELLDCGHDDIHRLDLLDALASTGLLLVEGPGASEAYFDALRRTTERKESA